MALDLTLPKKRSTDVRTGQLLRQTRSLLYLIGPKSFSLAQRHVHYLMLQRGYRQSVLASQIERMQVQRSAQLELLMSLRGFVHTPRWRPGFGNLSPPEWRHRHQIGMIGP